MTQERPPPQPAKATIPVSYAAWVARTLHLAEAELDDLLRGTGLAASQLADETALMSSEQLVAVLENALAITPDATFGLALGQSLTPPTHGSLGYLALSSPNLRAAMLAFADFTHLRLGVFNMAVEESSESLTLKIEVNMAVSAEVYRCLTEGAMVSIQSVAEHIVGRPINGASAEFSFADPGQNYSGYLHPQVQFGASATRLVFPREWASITNITANHAGYALAIEQCQQQLLRLELQPKTMTTRVQTVMLSYPPGQVSEQQIADAFFITKRTLARRLAREDSSFRKIREAYMAALAKKYLSETSLSVEAIAGLLNYYDTSSFRRAFKKWCGMAPQQFRHTAPAGEALHGH